MTFPPESPFGQAISQMRGAALSGDQDALVRKVREEMAAERTAASDADIRQLRERLSDVRQRVDGYVITSTFESDNFLAEIASELDDIEQDLRKYV